MKWVKRFFILALVVLVAIQFVRPEKNNKGYTTLDAFVAETKPTEAVTHILKTSCYDCHSDQTVYPWYAEIAPISFWLDEHIDHGKGHLNFSEWSTYSTKRKDHKLDELIEMVESKEMPLDSYTWVHKDAILDETQMTALLNWAQLARLNYIGKNEVQ